MGNEVDITVSAHDKTGPGAASARKNMAGIGDSAKRVGEVAQGVLASEVFSNIGQAASRGFAATYKAASDLNESVNAVGVTFGTASSGVLKLGDNAAQSMGLSKSAFNQAAVSMSSFASTIAGEGGDVTKIIGDLTQRSADFASVLNLDVNESLDLFRSGLAGESEPLRKYGIDVSAAATNTFAYANGIAETGQQLTEAQKVQARYGLIMEQTSKMQGDFANTAGDAANATRISKAELENARAEIGENLLPVMSILARALSAVLGVFSDLPGPVQAVVSVVTLLGAAALIVIPRLVATTAALQGMGLTAKTTGKLMLGVLGPIGALIAAGSALGDVFNDNDEAFANWDKKLSGLVSQDKASEAKKTFGALVDQFGQFGFTVDEIKEKLPGYTAALAAQEAEAESAAAAQEGLAGATDQAGESTATATEKLQEHIDTLRAATDPVFGLLGALDTLKESQDAYNESVKTHGANSAEAEGAAIDVAKALAGVEAAASDGELSFDQFQGQLKTWVKQGVLTAKQAQAIENRVKKARGEADRYSGDYVAKLRTKVDWASLGAANKALVQLTRDRIVSVIPKTIGNILWGAFEHGGTVGAHAAEGGPRGGRTLVGEGGPEILDLPAGTRVHSNPDTERMLAGGGGEQRLVIEVHSGGSRMDDLLVEILRKAIKIQGGDVQTVLGRKS